MQNSERMPSRRSRTPGKPRSVRVLPEPPDPPLPGWSGRFKYRPRLQVLASVRTSQECLPRRQLLGRCPGSLDGRRPSVAGRLVVGVRRAAAKGIFVEPEVVSPGRDHVRCPRSSRLCDAQASAKEMPRASGHGRRPRPVSSSGRAWINLGRRSAAGSPRSTSAPDPRSSPASETSQTATCPRCHAFRRNSPRQTSTNTLCDLSP